MAAPLPPNAKPPAPVDSVEEHLKNLYILYYKDQLSTKLMKTFYCTGGRDLATTRALSHCRIMQYRFIRIEPMMADLDADEKAKLAPTGQ